MITVSDYGNVGDKKIKEFLLSKDNISVHIINYGGIITKYIFDDTDVVLGYDTLEEYLNTTDYYGATIGRVCNRIAFGKFTLNGVEYQLSINNGCNSLHGGKFGFNKKVFDYEIKEDKLILSYLSKDGEEGYPANIQVKVIYYLDGQGLHIEFNAEADNDTICNLTNHSFFNLNGHGSGNILKHQLMIDSDRILPVNKNLVPTGMYMSVENTPFDFRKFKVIGTRINQDNGQLKIAGGYDHSFVFKGDGLKKVATLIGNQTKIKLDVLTDQKSMQLYCGNFLNGDRGKGGKIYEYRSAVCLETQGYPNAINCKEYPSIVLKKGENYIAKTIYRLYR